MQSNGTLLETRGLAAFYGDFQALFDIDFRIERNETVAVIGSNGAGKSTLLKSIIGLVRAKAEAVHALLAVVDRLMVINFGKKIEDGEPRSVMASRAVKEIYMGREEDAI